MLPDDHRHFFQRGIAGPFAEAVDGTFYLSCACNNASNGIGCCQTKIVVAMAGYNGFINIGYIIF